MLGGGRQQGGAPILVFGSPPLETSSALWQKLQEVGGGFSYFCLKCWAKRKQQESRNQEARPDLAAGPRRHRGGARAQSRSCPSPAGPSSPFSLGRSPRSRMDCAPPPLLCSVIQTWKVNNTLTSSGVCVLLQGYFPEYLALSKRGALRLPKKGPGSRAGRPRGGAAPPPPPRPCPRWGASLGTI